MNRVGFYLAHFNIAAVCGVLAGAFGVQFLEGEIPCPLCVMQRMAMLLCALGPAHVLLQTRRGEATPSDLATGYGLSVVAAVVGAAISGRQVLLHIVPPDPGFGDPVLGLHLYTWAFIVFVVVLLMSGVNLIFNEALTPRGMKFNTLSTIVVGLLMLLTVGNLIAMLFLQGLHWSLPDDPERYQLFDDLKAFLQR